MNKRATAQFWLEFTTDISCLVLGNIFTYILFHVIFNKIQDYPFTEWVEYIVNIALSFIVVFVIFHSNIDIHKRNRLKEFSSVLKNVSLTYAMFITLMILTKMNCLIQDTHLFSVSFSPLSFHLSEDTIKAKNHRLVYKKRRGVYRRCNRNRGSGGGICQRDKRGLVFENKRNRTFW